MPRKPRAEQNPSDAVERTPPARLPLDRTKPPRHWRSRAESAEPVQEPKPRKARSPKAAKVAKGLEPSPPPTPEPRQTPEPMQAREPMPASDVRAHAAPERSVEFTPPAAAPATTPEPEWRARYGVDRLVLLVRDPYWTYAWWEVTAGNVERVQREVGTAAALVLRFYDVSAIDWDGRNHHDTFDIEVQDSAGNWYVELGRPGASWVAELGMRAADGRFVALVRSNFVTLPRDGMSSVVDEEWMVLEEDYRKLFELAGGEAIGLGSAEILRWLEERLRRELLGAGISSFGVSSLGVSSLSMQRKE